MKSMKKTKSDGLKIALPNGSLEEGTIRLFGDANLGITKSSRAQNARIDGGFIREAKFVRPQIVPDLVASGAYELGICGADCIEESQADVVVLAELPYGRGTSPGRAKVVLVTSKTNPIQRIQDIAPGSVLLCEYPEITRRAFERLGIQVTIRFSHGSTEGLVPEPFEYGVCLTDTGASLGANGLKIVEVLFETRTALIANRDAVKWYDSEIKTITHLLVGTLDARSFVFLTMNVSRGKRSAVLRVLPALKRPTITKLVGGRTFSLGTVVSKSEQNQVIASILQAGATDVLVQPILQMVRSW